MPIPVVKSWDDRSSGYVAKNFHTNMRHYRFPVFRMEPYFEGDRYMVNRDDRWEAGRLDYSMTDAPFPVIADCARKSIVRICNANTND